MNENEDQKVRDVLQAANVMEISRLNGRFSIGVIAHGPELTTVMAKNQLQTFLTELAFVYRDIYAKEPWNEYLVCSNRDCRKKTGLPETANISSEDVKVYSGLSEFNCTDCDAPMEFFYQPEQLLENLSNLFRQKVFASLLFTEGKKLSGFSLGWETTVREGYRDKVVTGTGDAPESPMSYEEYLEEFRRILGSDYNEETIVFNSAEWAVSHEARSSKASLPVIHAIYSLAQEKMSKIHRHGMGENASGQPVPVIGHTLVGSKALKIFQKIGFTAGPPKEGSDEVRVYSTLPALIQGTQKYIS